MHNDFDGPIPHSRVIYRMSSSDLEELKVSYAELCVGTCGRLGAGAGAASCV